MFIVYNLFTFSRVVFYSPLLTLLEVFGPREGGEDLSGRSPPAAGKGADGEFKDLQWRWTTLQSGGASPPAWNGCGRLRRIPLSTPFTWPPGWTPPIKLSFSRVFLVVFVIIYIFTR